MTEPVQDSPARLIRLCADDYGLSASVSLAIRQLLKRGRINATSVMVLPRSFDRAAALSLGTIKLQNDGIAIGLHLTLTAPFRPISADFWPHRDGGFLTLKETLTSAIGRRFRSQSLESEISAQLKAFVDAFGQAPDFIDGHQHVQLFPQIRDAVLKVARAQAPDAWVRQCGRVGAMTRRLHDRKALLLDILSVRFRRKAARLGVTCNPAFAGTYDFVLGADFARLFPTFLDGLPDGGLIMCHPGLVDDELKSLDPLTTLREQEYTYFLGDEFPRVLAAKGFTLV
jgi:hypothetical protein